MSPFGNQPVDRCVKTSPTPLRTGDDRAQTSVSLPQLHPAGHRLQRRRCLERWRHRPDASVQRNDDGEVVVDIDGDEVVLTSGLSGFTDCDTLLTHLRTEAAERVGPTASIPAAGTAGQSGVAASRSRRWRSTTWLPIRPTSPPPRRAPGALRSTATTRPADRGSRLLRHQCAGTRCRRGRHRQDRR